VGWESISRQTEWADPKTSPNIDLAVVNQRKFGKAILVTTHQKGFRTDLHGALQITGSNCKRGVSGFSLRGV
jgi:hypothetical protein